MQKGAIKHSRYAIGKGFFNLPTPKRQAVKREIMLHMKYTEIQAWRKLIRGEKQLFAHNCEEIERIFSKRGIEEPWGFIEQNDENED